jgi:hypothetical protein
MPYLQTLAFLCRSMGTEPDMEKVVHFMVRKGFKIVLVDS